MEVANGASPHKFENLTKQGMTFLKALSSDKPTLALVCMFADASGIRSTYDVIPRLTGRKLPFLRLGGLRQKIIFCRSCWKRYSNMASLVMSPVILMAFCLALL